MEKDFYLQERQRELGGTQESLKSYTARTYLLMGLGLLITFAVAWFFSQTYYGVYALAYSFYHVSFLHIILLVAELALVLAMTSFLHKMSVGAAVACFMLYAALTGLTFTVYFLLYDLESMILVFGGTALYFGGMAAFGHFTWVDLTRRRNLLLGGLGFLILANVLMMLLPGLQIWEQVMCSIGIVVFLGYTAYDAQRVREFYEIYQDDPDMLNRASIYSALGLYLDFVNLFLYLLRLFARQRNRK